MKIRRNLFLVFPLTVLVGALFTQSATAQAVSIQGEMMRWHKTTLVLDGPTTSETATSPNPFFDYRMTVTFSNGSSTITVPGYFATDGDAAESSATSGNKWKAHFAPTTTGSWTYEVDFRQGPGVAIDTSPTAGTEVSPYDGVSGSFPITESDKAGADFRAPAKGKLVYTGKRYPEWLGGGGAFLKAAVNSPETFLEYTDFDNTTRTTYPDHIMDWNPGDPTWQTDKGKGIIGIVNYISSLGMNSYYFLTMNAFGDGQKAFPWNGQTDFYSYDVSKLDQWQIVFDYMMSQGVQCQFVLGETENQSIFEEFGTSTIFDDSRKLYYREMVARFGYLNAVIWNIGEENGWDQDTWNNENDYSQRIAFAQYVSDLLPYNDNITIHNGPATNDDIFGEFITNGTGAYRGISYQGPHDSSPIGHDRILKWINDSAASGSPWIVSFDEPFWNGNETVNPNEFPVWRKNSLWAAYSAGAAGVGLYLGGGRDITQEDLREFENYYTLIGNTAAFIDSVFDDLALTASADALVSSGWCLAETGDTYLVYLENGGMTTLDLSGVSGDFDVSWYDPRNYGNLQSGSVTSVTGGSVQSLGNAPNSPSDDWVIIVSKREVTVPFSARLEAEDASFVAGTLLSDPDASGSGTNNYVSGQQGFNITWMITVETAAMLDLNFRIKVASAGSNSSMELVVTDLTSGVQTSYGTLDTSSTSWEIQSASDILFPAGDYDIELRDTQGASEFDVDYLELSASTESVQSYRSAVQAAAAPSGWSFLRSSDSNIGNSSNYNSLNPQTNRYAVNSSVRGFYRDATAYARASNNQAIIAAYQVPTDGDYGIINSVIEFLDPATSKDVQLFVYLNDSLQLQTPVIVAGQTVTFDISLDDLLANDTIYVILETDNGGGPDDRLIFNYDIAEFPSAPVIENFRQTVMADPAPSGWSFLRSKNNNIGDATRYSALNTFPNRYAVNSTVRGFYRDATAYARPSSSRAIIAAYQTPVDGNYSIANSIIEYIDPLTNKDVSLYVYVNDIAILTSPLFVTGGQSQTFDLNLGALTAGDTIYIILQTSNGGGSNDQLFLDYNIVR